MTQLLAVQAIQVADEVVARAGERPHVDPGRVRHRGLHLGGVQRGGHGLGRDVQIDAVGAAVERGAQQEHVDVGQHAAVDVEVHQGEQVVGREGRGVAVGVQAGPRRWEGGESGGC